jgi:hypothetical protein
LSDMVETPRCAMRTVCAIILIPCIMLWLWLTLAKSTS